MEISYNNDLYKISYQMKNYRRRKILNRIFVCIFIFVAIALILSFLVFPVRQKTNSMTPDIPHNSTLFCSPIITSINRGDVVLLDKDIEIASIPKKILNATIKFFTLQQKSLYSSSEQLSSRKTLRRVIGLPGDTIYMKDFIVYIKPQGEKYFLTEFELAEKLYNIEISSLPKNWDDSLGFKSEFSPVTLGANEYFVLADNRFSSLDSRLWGIVKRKDVISKALVVYFPFSKFKIF